MENCVLKQIQSVELDVLKTVAQIADENKITYYLGWGTLLGSIRHQGFIPWDDDIDIMIPRRDYDKFMNILKKELPNSYWIQNYETDCDYWQPFAKVRRLGSVYKEYGQENIPDEKSGIWIDLFPLDYFGGTLVKAKIKTLLIKTITYSLRIRKLHIPMRAFSRRYVPLILLWGLFPIESLKKIQYKLCVGKNECIGKYLVCFAGAINVEKEMFPVGWLEERLKYPFEGYEFWIPQNYDEILRQCYGDYMKLPPEENRRGHNIIEYSKLY